MGQCVYKLFMNRKSWFNKWGWIYLPKSWEGVLITVLALIFAIHIFLAVDAVSHSVSDTLYGIFPFWAPTFLGWLWIASKTSTHRL